MEQFNKEEFLRKYAEQDPRLQKDKTFGEIMANNDGVNLERIFKMGKGVMELHPIQVFDEIIPMRVVSMKEERGAQRHAFIQIKGETHLQPGTISYNMQLERFFYRRIISISTTACPQDISDPYLTEDDIDALPDMLFASLIQKYKDLTALYNPGLEALSEEHVSLLIDELRDPQKKFQSLITMNLTELRTVLNIYLINETSLEDNILLSKQLNV